LKLLKRSINLLDTLNEKIGYLVSWLTTVLVLVVCYDVFTRYFLKKSSVAVQELEWHLFSVIFLVGAAYTLQEDKHVRVDVLYVRLSKRTKAIINFVGGILFLLPFSILIIWASWDFVINSFMIKEISPNPGGLGARYVLKACIPFGFFLVFLQGLSLVFTSLLTLYGRDDG
jgi:TRAP-type mannitol/chloroaromatic compound transport system permease small subunit